ncbi:MAG: hypothetical protein ACTS4W_01250 [Candidatus Hodgkinia cicadicola]
MSTVQIDGNERHFRWATRKWSIVWTLTDGRWTRFRGAAMRLGRANDCGAKVYDEGRITWTHWLMRPRASAEGNEM